MLVLPAEDLEWRTCRGSGAGGQHRNTTDSAVQVTHKPSGLSVRCESERSQHQNKAAALDLLRSRLYAREASGARAAINSSRQDQIGSGMRGDKRRTIAMQRDQVQDHVSGLKMSSKAYLKGQVEDIWAD